MTTRVDEIQARLEAHVNGWNWQERVSCMRSDISYLLAEVKRQNDALHRMAKAVEDGAETETLALSLAEALEWFNDRRAVIQPKFDLHGPADTAEAMRGAFKAANAALSSPALLKLRGKE